VLDVEFELVVASTRQEVDEPGQFVTVGDAVTADVEHVAPDAEIRPVLDRDRAGLQQG